MSDEFAHRDSKGLVPIDPKLRPQGYPRPQDEAKEREHYFKLLATMHTSLGPLLAWLVYFAYTRLWPGAGPTVELKLAFVRRYSLGYIYIMWYMLFLTRKYLALNANGARAAARLARPDQHVYKIMAKEGPLADAPYVLMADTGAVGRFNRAQRAAMNMDESLHLDLTGLILVGAIFGPLAVALAALMAYSRIKMAHLYKGRAGDRLGGFVPAMAASTIMAASVGVVVVKVFGGLIVPQWL